MKGLESGGEGKEHRVCSYQAQQIGDEDADEDGMIRTFPCL